MQYCPAVCGRRQLGGEAGGTEGAAGGAREGAALLGRPELAGPAVRPLIVSDCKMVTDAAVLACHRAGLGYLGPLPPDIEPSL